MLEKKNKKMMNKNYSSNIEKKNTSKASIYKGV